MKYMHKTEHRDLFSNAVVVRTETISREEAIKELGLEAVERLERDFMLGIETHVALDHGPKARIKKLFHRLFK